MALAVMVFALQLIASESGEVVVLYTEGTDGIEEPTRLWVVEHEGYLHLRVSRSGSSWHQRLLDHNVVSVEREGTPARYRAEEQPALRDTVNHLMQEKYGWRETIIGVLVGGREDAIAVRLYPLQTLDNS